MLSRIPRINKRLGLFVFLVIVIVGLILLLIYSLFQSSGTTQNQSEENQSTSVPSSSVSSSSSGRGDHVFNVHVAADQQFSGVVPGDYQFKTSSLGIIYPVSPSLGPTYTPGMVGYCFAHNPTGAAMAAVQAVAVTDAPGVSEAELKDLLSSSASSSFQASSSEPVRDTRIAGYEIESYSPTSAKVAVIALVTREDNSKQDAVKVTVPVVWENGDWKVDTDPGTLEPVLATQVPSQIFKKDGANTNG